MIGVVVFLLCLVLLNALFNRWERTQLLTIGSTFLLQQIQADRIPDALRDPTPDELIARLMAIPVPPPEVFEEYLRRQDEAEAHTFIAYYDRGTQYDAELDQDEPDMSRPLIGGFDRRKPVLCGKHFNDVEYRKQPRRGFNDLYKNHRAHCVVN